MTTNLNKATASNFQLIFPKIPTGDSVKDMKQLTMNIHSTVIPSLTLGTADVMWQGGVAHQDIGEITFEPWYVNFTVDSTFTNWLTLYKWLTFINNNKDTYGRPANHYKIDATLQIVNNFREQILVMDIHGLWCNMLGEITLSYREGSQNLESSANFIYDRYEIRNIT
jgi:hypothetical protein